MSLKNINFDPSDLVPPIKRCFSSRELVKVQNVARMNVGLPITQWVHSSLTVMKFIQLFHGVMDTLKSRVVIADSLVRTFRVTPDHANGHLVYAVSTDQWKLCASPCLLCGSFLNTSQKLSVPVSASFESSGDLHFRHSKLVQLQLNSLERIGINALLSECLMDQESNPVIEQQASTKTAQVEVTKDMPVIQVEPETISDATPSTSSMECEQAPEAQSEEPEPYVPTPITKPGYFTTAPPNTPQLKRKTGTFPTVDRKRVKFSDEPDQVRPTTPPYCKAAWKLPASKRKYIEAEQYLEDDQELDFFDSEDEAYEDDDGNMNFRT